MGRVTGALEHREKHCKKRRDKLITFVGQFWNDDNL